MVKIGLEGTKIMKEGTSILKSDTDVCCCPSVCTPFPQLPIYTGAFWFLASSCQCNPPGNPPPDLITLVISGLSIRYVPDGTIICAPGIDYQADVPLFGFFNCRWRDLNAQPLCPGYNFDTVVAGLFSLNSDVSPPLHWYLWLQFQRTLDPPLGWRLYYRLPAETTCDPQGELLPDPYVYGDYQFWMLAEFSDHPELELCSPGVVQVIPQAL